jgi:hypothetical protein
MNKIDICNMALALLNRERIDSLEDDSTEAKTARIFYDHERKRLLRMFGWGFARKTDQLALRTNEIPGWQYVYGLPKECAQVLFVFNDATVDRHEFTRPDFRIVTATGADKVIVTNLEDAWAEYTYNCKDSESFSEEFTEALVHLMAAKMSIPLTNTTDFVQMHMQLAQSAVDVARAEDAEERDRRTMWPRQYERARFS